MFAAAAPRLARAPRAHSAHTSRAALSAVPTMLHTKPAVAMLEGACLRAFTPSTMPTMPKIRPTYTYRKENTIERMPTTSRVIEGKTILESKFPLQLNDMMIAMSDGAIWAGVGQSMNFGWQRDNVVEFAERMYEDTLSAKMMAALIVDECNRLYAGEPGDDTTVAAVRVRERKPVNLMIGPPADPADVGKMMALFFAKEGRKIVCGGTTSKLAAGYLHEDVVTSLDYGTDPDIPPIATIRGIDLVTEGVITLSRVVEYANVFLNNSDLANLWSLQTDGASRIAQYLFEYATDICFFVGRAINPAHQNPDLPITFGIKIQLVKQLSEALEKMGKRVSVSYF